MDRTTFDDLAKQLATGRLDRRHLVRRMLGIGVGATALAGGMTLLPGTGGQALASQTPLDPPPGWPPYLPWPWGPGPTFPLAVPRSTLRSSGIAFYIGGLDPATGVAQVVGLTDQGEEVRRLEFQQLGRNAIGFRMSQGRTSLGGSTIIEALPEGGGHFSGEIDGQLFEVTVFKDGTSEVGMAVKTDDAKGALFAEFSLIAQEMFRVGQTLVSEPSLPQAGCTGCVFTLGGLGFGAVGCALSTAVGAAIACGGAWLGAVGAWVDNCEGACAD